MAIFSTAFPKVRKLKVTQRSFVVAAPGVWNGLLRSLKDKKKMMMILSITREDIFFLYPNSQDGMRIGEQMAL